MHRRTVTAIRGALDALDTQVSRLGRLGSTAAITALAIAALVPLHLLVRRLEHLPVQWAAVVNLSLEVAVIAAPIILYSRDVIAKLKAAREKFNEMSRRLAISVDQAEQANRAKSAFLANMSHELRTPLNAIMGFSEVMKDQHLGPLNNARYVAYAGDIHASGVYLLGIINDILDLSKIEAGKMTLEQAEEFVLRDTLHASLGMVSGLGEKFGVELISELPEPHVRLHAVERMIRQIVINLVGNAIKFTPAGGQVFITGTALADGGYTLTVRDTGIGMGEDEIVHALTPFGQIANKMSARHTGTGLGLPLARAMLELHGGKLDIQSQLHIGTTIVLTFPNDRLAMADKAAAA